MWSKWSFVIGYRFGLSWLSFRFFSCRFSFVKISVFFCQRLIDTTDSKPVVLHHDYFVRGFSDSHKNVSVAERLNGMSDAVMINVTEPLHRELKEEKARQEKVVLMADLPVQVSVVPFYC